MVSFRSAFESCSDPKSHLNRLLVRSCQNIRLAIKARRFRGRFHVVAVAPLTLCKLLTEALLSSSIQIRESAEAFMIVLESFVSNDHVGSILLYFHQFCGNHGMELHREERGKRSTLNPCVPCTQCGGNAPPLVVKEQW